MIKAKINWHTTSAKILKKDVVLERFNRYLEGIGLHTETVKRRRHTPLQADGAPKRRGMIMDPGKSDPNLS